MFRFITLAVVLITMTIITTHAYTIRSHVKMGLFDAIFGPKLTASASHILVKGPNAPNFLTELKAELVGSKNVEVAFAEAAAKYSTCPSAPKGGRLGTFKQGQMVPAFDEVVFKEAIGVIHGPIKTPFGAHLILIEERSKPTK